MAFGTLLWKSVILTSVALLLRDIAGIGSAPQSVACNPFVDFSSLTVVFLVSS